MAITSVIRHDVLSGESQVINWDGYGYYVYLPATVIYEDIEQYGFVDDHFATYDISSDVYQLMDTPNGTKFPIYNIGLAVWWTPAFLATHALVTATGLAPPDGMSFPYQLMVILMGLLTIFLGFFYLRKFLKVHFSDGIVALLLLGLGLATNLFYYVVEEPDMTHGYLFAGYAAFLWCFHRYLTTEKGKKRWLVTCGLIAGLMCLTRSSEIVIFAIPALYGLKDISSLKSNFRRTTLMVAIALSVFSFQLIFYKAGTGQWFHDGYKGLGFDWLAPHLYEGFIGYRRGWLIYTPLMAFALLGIFWLRKGWLILILLFTIANCYLLFSWQIWWYGNTFGSRPVVQSYAVLALPLGALLTWVLGSKAGAKSIVSRAVTGVLFSVFILLNLFQHWQYNQRIIPLDFTNSTYYWHVFGKMELSKKDRVFLDTNEKLPSGDYQQTILQRTDTLLAVPPKVSREFTNLLEYRVTEDATSTTWIRTNTRFAYYGQHYDKWKFPSIVTEHRRGDETLKWVQVNIARTVEQPQADSLQFDLSLPDLRAGDIIKQYVWNLSQDSLSLHQHSNALLRR